MGSLIFHKTTSFALDDRLLAHLELAIRTKLGRHEPFMMTIKTSPVEGSGRTTVWVHSGSSLVFKYRESRKTLNRAWVHSLLQTANSPAGLHITDEPPALDGGVAQIP